MFGGNVLRLKVFVLVSGDILSVLRRVLLVVGEIDMLLMEKFLSLLFCGEVLTFWRMTLMMSRKMKMLELRGKFLML